jgi:hypothetical protein
MNLTNCFVWRVQTCLFNEDLAVREGASFLSQLSVQILALEIECFLIMSQGLKHGQCLGHLSAKQTMVLDGFNHAAEQNTFEWQNAAHEAIDGAVFMSQSHDGCGSAREGVSKASCQSIIILANPCVSAHSPDSGSHLSEGELSMKRGDGTSQRIEGGIAVPCEPEG